VGTEEIGNILLGQEEGVDMVGVEIVGKLLNGTNDGIEVGDDIVGSVDEGE
jgi:hypothetical protein